MKRRYAIFTALYPPHMGGIEQFSERLACELVAEGHCVDVITSHFADLPYRESPCEGLRIWRLLSRMFLDGRLPLFKKGRAWSRRRSSRR